MIAATVDGPDIAVAAVVSLCAAMYRNLLRRHNGRDGTSGARGVIEVRKSVLVGFAAESMFDLVEAAEDYPLFLPWCSAAVILARDESMVAAEITVDYRGARFSFVTRNPKRRPDWMAIRLERGPFRRFEGEWHLSALSPAACKIVFDLRYELAGTLVRTIAAPVFGRIADTLVDAFVARAEATLPRADG